MKNFKHFLFALTAIVLGFAITACTYEPDTNKPAIEASVNVETGDIDQTSAAFKITTTNIAEVAWVLTDKDDLDATQVIGGGERIKIENVQSATTNILVKELEPSTTYTMLVAAVTSDEELYAEVIKVDFTTTGFGNALTVLEQYYDGFKLHLTIPEDVKARENAVRY